MRLILEEEDDQKRLEDMIVLELTGLYNYEIEYADDMTFATTTRESQILSVDMSMRNSTIPNQINQISSKGEPKKPKVTKSLFGQNFTYPDEKNKPGRLFQFKFPSESYG